MGGNDKGCTHIKLGVHLKELYIIEVKLFYTV